MQRSNLAEAIDRVTIAFHQLRKVLRPYSRSRSRWRMMNKNGQNRKERLRNQVALKGRRCKKRSGYKTHR